ncbi:MAG: 30S ribosomal protein S8e [Candidatus Aenigmarchaeota archaeon]|nr:30S ribosomal protein S8e [Candidatus Aenigmarchaeota archaeon]
MTKWHIDTGKKVTGGRIHQYRKKKKFQRGSIPLLTEVGKEKKFVKRSKGGAKKVKLAATEFVNATDSKSNKTKKVKILDVLENPASPNYVRRGILTKGTVVKTEFGKVRITSRPSQVGVVSGVIVEGK